MVTIIYLYPHDILKTVFDKTYFIIVTYYITVLFCIPKEINRWER